MKYKINLGWLVRQTLMPTIRRVLHVPEINVLDALVYANTQAAAFARLDNAPAPEPLTEYHLRGIEAMQQQVISDGINAAASAVVIKGKV